MILMEVVVGWIVQNVSAKDVPGYEGKEEAFVYNLVQLAHYGRPYEEYDCKPEQDEELRALYDKWGRPEEDRNDKDFSR